MPSPVKRKGARALHTALKRLGVGLAVFLMCLGILQLVTTGRGAYIALFPGHRNRVITDWEQTGRNANTTEGLKHYPTDLTRDVLTIPCHSHNDYWRDVPLYSGISAGCISTEADVWQQNTQNDGSLSPDELLVGHDESSLTRNRTLRSLYVDPLLDILKRQNPTTDFVDGSQTRNGVFDTDANQVFTLLIDLKTDGNSTFDAVVSALDPLRQKGYLTYVDSQTNKVIERPIRIVATGSTPFSAVLSAQRNPHRDIFFDAPVADMATMTEAATAEAGAARNHRTRGQDYTPENSYYASGSFMDVIGFMWGWSLSAAQLQKLRAQIKGAHARGLKVRYWDTPAWPVSRRNRLWETLVEEGADVLNVDDLRGAVEEDWRRDGGWWGDR